MLKLPNQNEWRELLECYGDILREEIVETEYSDVTNDEETELPPFIAKRCTSDAYTENDYTIQIIGELFKGKELNSYVHRLRMIRNVSNTEEDLVNHKKAWEKVSKYLRDYDALLEDTNKMGAKYDYIPWEKPPDFMWINPDLQPYLLPDV